MIHNAPQHRKDNIVGDLSVLVLICDDELRIREELKSLLSTYTLLELNDTILKIKIVGEASNGREAIQMVAKYQPDVVSMDARMPFLDGF